MDAQYQSTVMPATDGNRAELTIASDRRLRVDAAAEAATADIGTVQPFSQPGSRWSYAAAASGIMNTTTAVTIKVAAGAGVRNYITDLQINTATLGAATEFVVRDGAAGTVQWLGQLFQTPLRGTANTLLEVATLTAVTGGVFFNAQGHTAA